MTDTLDAVRALSGIIKLSLVWNIKVCFPEGANEYFEGKLHFLCVEFREGNESTAEANCKVKDMSHITFRLKVRTIAVPTPK